MISLKVGGTWSASGITGGVPLRGIGWVGDLSFKTTWPGGFLTVSWRMNLPAGYVHPALRQGSLVEVFENGLRLGYGRMAEPNREEWAFVADGMQIALSRCLALDAAKAPSTNLDEAITQAAARGWPVKVGAGIPATELSTLSESGAQGNYLTALLDAYCETTGERWWVDASGAVSIAADPVDGDIDWVLTPGVPAMATAEDDYASLVVVRYVDAMTGTEPSAWLPASAEDATSATRHGPRERFEDITALGLLTSSQATANAQAILDANGARPGFSQGVEVLTYQVTTPGGTAAHLSLIQAGQRVQHHGILSSDGSQWGTSAREWVIGGTDYEAGSRSIVLTPVGLAPRGLAKTIKGVAFDRGEFS